MSEGVVSDRMPGANELAHNIGPLTHVASDQKKCRMDLMFREHFQQAQCVGIIGAIIVRKCQLLRSAPQPSERPSIPLPGWRHRLVSSSCDCCSGGKSEAQHGDILIGSLQLPIDTRHNRLSQLGVNFLLNCSERQTKLCCQTSFRSFYPIANLFELPRYIAVEGPIRVGKSTLA